MSSASRICRGLMHSRGDPDRHQKLKEESVAAKCRERRRRRIEMRRAMSTPATNNKSSSLKSPGAAAGWADDIHDAEAAVPNCGSMSLAGRMRQMEDAITIKMNLCRLPDQDNRPLHFFAVYDGHGGPHVASYCRARMHVYMREELMRGQGQEMTEEWWQQAMKRCFKRMDEVVLSTCGCGNIGYDCGTHPTDVMGLVGSTAVVALLTPDHIFVANCGDSRAVLSSWGKVIPLSNDQKPDRADEFARIRSLGGRVIELNGARVEGILAMSRAIGDKFLKTFVISEPEIIFAKREPDRDEFLILASDGLWDVVPSDVACNIVRDCLQEENADPSYSHDPSSSVGPRVTDQGAVVGTTNPSRIASAAALLTRMALGRESSDNISVIVVDLKSSF